jgi:Protein of unknown function (DUF3431)
MAPATKALLVLAACSGACFVMCAASHAGMACTRDVELVISQCSQDPSRLIAEARRYLPPEARVTVYSKCPATAHPGAVPLPNVGREGHTFLYHIVSRYDSLADRTIFLMESAGMTLLKRTMMRDLLTNWCADRMHCPKIPHVGDLQNFTCGEWKGTTHRPGTDASTAPATIRPFGEWFSRMIDPTRAPPRMFCHAAMLSVSRDAIRSRPRAFYQKLLEELGTHSNPESGHFLERSWGAIFQ